MEGFICFSKGKEEFDYNGKRLGYGPDRAIYTASATTKVYRSSYPVPLIKNYKLLIFKNWSDAKLLCDGLNECYNDDFKVVDFDHLS